MEKFGWLSFWTVIWSLHELVLSPDSLNFGCNRVQEFPLPVQADAAELRGFTHHYPSIWHLAPKWIALKPSSNKIKKKKNHGMGLNMQFHSLLLNTNSALQCFCL